MTELQLFLLNGFANEKFLHVEAFLSVVLEAEAMIFHITVRFCYNVNKHGRLFYFNIIRHGFFCRDVVKLTNYGRQF